MVSLKDCLRDSVWETRSMAMILIPSSSINSLRSSTETSLCTLEIKISVYFVPLFIIFILAFTNNYYGSSLLSFEFMFLESETTWGGISQTLYIMRFLEVDYMVIHVNLNPLPPIYCEIW